MAPFPAIKSEIDFAELADCGFFILENANAAKKVLPGKAEKPHPIKAME